MGCGHHLRHDIRVGDAVGQVHGGVEAGDAQLQIPQLANSCGDVMLVERAAPVGQGREFKQVVNLDAGEFHILGGGQQFLPA